ncbi:polyprenyl synthetase family protein [Pseudoclavibacter sp. CFCC 14310]|uniref:polyprenyl synthetase family protein n=1 Tax=Pseudoclavibacter sp. CFCC 14310 TaxID=2615180 RepID=UPI00130195FE|nr:polyprenyl synthetase family protein [Pseudoclavibacter sp. CFCC 14310]KAB1646466.1 polyprenyl synthetase family protein [Pseudoclavibacter sp. CFCC 14310]
MTAHSTLLQLVQDRIDAFLSRESAHLRRISPLATPLTDELSGLLHGGKRFRSQFCYWGWRAAETDADEELSRIQLESVLQLSAAIELFHAAALVHDDVIDNSDTRRGRPAAHVSFAELHRSGHWRGDSAQFGSSAAVVLGDLLLGWSQRGFADAVDLLPEASIRRRLRELIADMTTEVMVGQYLDILGEHAWPALPDDEALERSETVMLYKSAKYSIEQPLLIGAAVAGADDEQASALSTFGVHAGLAFQLRDDVLGVFGDPAQTGKPAGDDLREGKRTVLVALTRSMVPATVRHVVDDLLGDPTLTSEQIQMLQETIVESGALAATERLIDDHSSQADAALQSAPIVPPARRALGDLARQAAQRTR